MKGYIVKSNYKVAPHHKDEVGCTSKLNTSLSGTCQGSSGRSDLFIKSVSRRRIAIVIEFKIANDIDDLEKKADEAIEQIEDMELRSEGYKNICKYGIAFYKKDCLIKIKD
ncbi:PD-(D/E)XK nuclease domain-containing protein [Clostridium butyricum]|nr:PD-(D/E)XK nuclease domain-containing protein [Clostridium butyricum]